VVRVAAELMHVDGVGLLLLDDKDQPRAVATNAPAAAALEAAEERLNIGPGIDTLTTDATVAVADVADSADYAALWEELIGSGVRAVLASPVRIGGQVIGNLNAIGGDPREWSAGDERAVEAFADIIGQILRLASAIEGRAIFDTNGRRATIPDTALTVLTQQRISDQGAMP
jgi:GAF domain-containing protein